MRSIDFKRDFNSSGKGFIKILITIMALLFITLALPSFAQDATGANTGTINDIAASTAGKPTIEEIGAATGHNQIAINIMWNFLSKK